MLTTATFAQTSLTGIYDRNGRPEASLRSAPARPVADLGDHGSTTAGKYQDQVSLSPDGIEKSRSNENSTRNGGLTDEAAKADDSPRAERASSDSRELTATETKMLRELQARDREVRAHEMAHLITAGQYARGGASYTYQQGPDGRQYAIGGEVPIDTGKEDTPEETIQKMEAVKQAALAPSDPSAADHAIAAEATATATQARQELRTQQQAADTRQQQNDNAPAKQEDQALFSSSRAAVASGQRMMVNVFA